MERGSVTRAALMGGLLTAVLNATPFVGGLNGCCCILTVLGGVFAGWALASDAGGTASLGRCGIAGAFSGLIGGLVGIPLGALLGRWTFGAAELERKLDEALQAATATGSDMPPGFVEAMEELLRGTSGLELNAWTFVATLFGAAAFSFFGLLGGIVGGRLGRGAPPAAPPAPGPATAPAPPAAPAAGVDGSPLAPPPPPAAPLDAPPDIPEPPRDPPAWAGAPPEAATDAEGLVPPDELPRFPPRDEPPR